MRVKPFVLAAAVLAATPGTAQDEVWRNGLLPFEPEVLQPAAEIYLGFLEDYEVEFGTLAVAYGDDPMLELGRQIAGGGQGAAQRAVHGNHRCLSAWAGARRAGLLRHAPFRGAGFA